MEQLERGKTLLRGMLEKIRQANIALGRIKGSERVFPLETKSDGASGEYLDRAKAIIEGDVNEIRFKILTLGQLSKSERWHPVGKKGEEMWNEGEWVLAFEDGTLAFKQSGSELLSALDYTDDLAKWIALLDSFHEKWESGPPSKFQVVRIQ